MSEVAESVQLIAMPSLSRSGCASSTMVASNSFEIADKRINDESDVSLSLTPKKQALNYRARGVSFTALRDDLCLESNHFNQEYAIAALTDLTSRHGA